MERRDLTRNAAENEKAIESHLCALTKRAGGIALKFASATQTGYPDRLLLFPGGTQVWVEVKSRGRHPTRLQATRISRLRAMGQRVEICDSRERAEEIILLRGSHSPAEAGAQDGEGAHSRAEAGAHKQED